MEEIHDQNPLPCQQFLLQIPKEILTNEILPRLPVKSLLRFKCVSRSWKSLIENDRFMKTQYRNSAKNPRVVFNPNKDTMKECSLQSLLKSKEGSDPTKYEPKAGTLVGCSNYMVCFYNYQYRRFSLCNPAIKTSIKLPKVFGLLKKCGFGWDESSGAYKVFAVMCKTHKTIGKVYSSKAKSWSTIERGCLSVTSEIGTLVGGKLHWALSRKHGIECFDLEREEFGRIELPLNNAAKGSDDRPWLWLGEIGGCLSVLFNLPESLEVWVMKEYSIKDSWFKLFTIPTGFEISSEICDLITPLFGEGLNGEIFIIYGENLWICSPKDGAFSTVRNNVDFIRAGLYVESLVSPKRILMDATNTT